MFSRSASVPPLALRLMGSLDYSGIDLDTLAKDGRLRPWQVAVVMRGLIKQLGADTEWISTDELGNVRRVSVKGLLGTTADLLESMADQVTSDTEAHDPPSGPTPIRTPGADVIQLDEVFRSRILPDTGPIGGAHRAEGPVAVEGIGG